MLNKMFKLPARKTYAIFSGYTARLVAAIRDYNDGDAQVEYVIVGEQNRLPISFTTICENSLCNCSNDILTVDRSDVAIDPSHAIAKYNLTLMPESRHSCIKTIDTASPRIMQFIIDFHCTSWRLNYTIQKMEFGKTSISIGNDSNIIAFMEVEFAWSEVN